MLYTLHATRYTLHITMSRHSKWAKIKHGKGAADQKRGAIFSKLTRTISVAAREGGDPEMNFKLRMAIDQAKVAQMPKDNIDRAIAKGSGADKEGAQLLEETYEGFGPGGVAFMVEVITDNKNRAYQELRKTFSDHGGNLASPGAVAWQFTRHGVLHLQTKPLSHLTTEQLELILIDAGAEDILQEDDGITVYTKPEELKAVEEKVRAAGLAPEYAGLEWVPREKSAPPENVRGQLDALEEALDELEDVSEYYTNAS